jgi:hypothetical protein
MPAPASETKREKIVRVLLARLRTILTANDYNTQVGQNVFYWRTGTFSEEEIAGMTGNCALVVRDIDETKATDGDHTKVNKVSTDHFSRDLHIQIEIVQLGTNSPTTVHKLIADIESAIRKDIRWRDTDGGALAIGTRPRIDRSVVEQESKKVSGVIYEFFIHYVTGAFNAYA